MTFGRPPPPSLRDGFILTGRSLIKKRQIETICHWISYMLAYHLTILTKFKFQINHQQLNLDFVHSLFVRHLEAHKELMLQVYVRDGIARFASVDGQRNFNRMVGH